MTTSRSEQLEWEARYGRPAGIAAALAAIAIIGASIYLQSSIGEGADDTDDLLRLVDEHASAFVISGVIQAIGLLALIPALGYFYRATRFRRPQTPRIAVALLIAGPIMAAVLGIVRQAEFVNVAGDFIAGGGGGGDAEDRAENLIDDSSLPIVSGIGFAANLTIGFALVLLSLNAMRAGLTSRFIGIIGIIIGALYVLPVAGGPQIIQVFWLIALALLFIGTWPQGRGPAWDTGEAIPWPTAAEMAERREAERAGADEGNGSPNGRGAGEAAASADPDTPRPRKRKKRKKR